jgi:hypothetical protein
VNKFLSDRPWIWIVVGFVVMIVSLAVVVVIAEKNEPKSIPMENSDHDGP